VDRTSATRHKVCLLIHNFQIATIQPELSKTVDDGILSADAEPE
jgi:hypothetical protein